MMVVFSVVTQIDQIPMEDRDTKGDLYEYMLSKLNNDIPDVLARWQDRDPEAETEGRIEDGSIDFVGHAGSSSFWLVRDGIEQIGTGSLRGDTELKALLYKVFTGLASKTRKYRLCKGLRCFITR